MTRTALALAALLTLSLNGSIAVAAVAACTGGSTCSVPLGMRTASPGRPADLPREVAMPLTAGG